MADYALFHNGHQISRPHSTYLAAATEAYEHYAVIQWGPDFAGDKSGVDLADGYEVRPVEEER